MICIYSSEHHSEVFPFVSGRVRYALEAHVAAHLVEGAPLVLRHPRFKVCTDEAKMAGAVPEKSRDYLRDVSSCHRCLDHVKRGVHSARDGKRGVDATRESRGASEPESEVR